MLTAKHSMLFSSALNRLCDFSCVGHMTSCVPRSSFFERGVFLYPLPDLPTISIHMDNFPPTSLDFLDMNSVFTNDMCESKGVTPRFKL